jgi:aconitate hydratase
MRAAVAEAGGDPSVLNPVLPVDVSVDHSIAVDAFGGRASARINMTREVERNAERFRLMKWAQNALSGVRVHPPGTGILHSFNMEQLATVIGISEIDGRRMAVPDTLIGTDSHTPMINGIGVLAWGVGGLEAEGVFFGLPVVLRVPDVIGVRLLGRMPEGTLATDLALTVTQRLRDHGVSGEFVEFFGPGVSTLSAGERAVVANMAPEYGASTAYFPIDAATTAYLTQTGRDAAAVRLVEEVAKAQGLWFDPAAEPRYTDVIDIDLSTLTVSIAGPRRPQDRLSPAQAQASIQPIIAARDAAGGADRGSRTHVDGSVAVAAITSCTNTTDPRLILAAGLMARKARALGLAPKSWVKTSLSPGSPAARRYLERAGLLEDLEAIGFGIVGYGCMTCIGNSGPLTEEMNEAVERGGTVPVAILSGNRNFPGRVHPQIEAGFLASPPLVIAYALKGDVNLDILKDPIGTGPDGTPVHLADIWPSGAEIDAALLQATDRSDYGQAFRAASDNAEWNAIPAPRTPLYPFEVTSTYLRRPPFAGFSPSRLGAYAAHPIMVLGDDVTTDQISPAGAIPSGSEAARYLVANGADENDLNVFASRRGNFEVMVRGLFTNRAVVNLIAPGIPAGSTVHVPSGDVLPLHEAAARYRDDGGSVVILAGERYGAGSSRDWAAKGPSLLGVRAVVAQSFERIHRQNLICMGILPLEADADLAPNALGLVAGDLIEIDAPREAITPRCRIPLRIRRMSGEIMETTAKAAVETRLEVSLLKGGGIIPYILARAAAEQGNAPASAPMRTAG